MNKNIKSLEAFLLLMVIIFCALGVWQVKRLAWKNHILSSIEASTNTLKINKIDNLSKLLYKPILLRGRLHHDKEIHVYSGGKLAHGSDGYLIFTPLEIMDGSFILINRGWVPRNKKDPSKRAETLIMGIVEISGNVLDIKKPKWQMFDNNAESNVWLWLDIDKISNHIEIDVPPYYIMQQGNWKNLPINTRFDAKAIKNNHLQYALTWFGLGALTFILALMIKISASGKTKKL